MAGLVLALDIATNTGAALGDPADGLPLLTSIRFGEQGDSLEASFAAAMSWMAKTLKEHNPRRVVFESPMPPSFMRGHTTANTIRKLQGLAAIIGGTAHKLGFLDIAEAPVADIRLHFLGSRRIKSADAKKATVAKCRELGLVPRNDNEADAAALWFYAAGLHAAQPELIACPRARKPKKAGQSASCRALV